jgi:hypothetical protein
MFQLIYHNLITCEYYVPSILALTTLYFAYALFLSSVYIAQQTAIISLRHSEQKRNDFTVGLETTVMYLYKCHACKESNSLFVLIS